jgi:hypothetical protein
MNASKVVKDTRAKVIGKVNIYGEAKSPGEVVTVDATTFRNLEKKKLLERAK